MSGGQTDKNQAGGPADWGGWGQFDPLSNGDAASFQHASQWVNPGGSEDSVKAAYQGLTPAQQAQWRQIEAMPHMSGAQSSARDDAMKSFVSGLPGSQGQSQGGAVAGTTPNAGDPTVSNSYMQSATPSVESAWGSSQWHQDPTTGQWTVTQGPTSQLADANGELLNAYQSNIAKGLGTGDDARNQAVNAAYGQATSRLDPQWSKREASERTQLLNQGLDPSSQAYQSAMQDFGLQRNDAYSSAMNNAISQGTQAGHTAFEDNLAAYNNPLQQMAGIKGLSAEQSHPELLNAYIAQQNAALKQRSDLMQQNTDLTGAGMNFAGNLVNGILS